MEKLKSLRQNRLGGSNIGDDFYRKCPMCKKILTVMQLGANFNRCTNCGTLILA